MKHVLFRWMTLGGACFTAAAAAQVPEAPAPPPPPPPTAVRPDAPPPPGMPGMPARPGGLRPEPGMGGFRFSPIGSQANMTFMTLQANREDLNITDEQNRRITELWQKSREELRTRGLETRRIQEELQTLTEADTLNMPRIEAQVRAIEKIRSEDTLADIRLNDALKKVLTADQRAKLKTMPGLTMGGFGRPGARVGPGMPGVRGGPGAPGAPGAPVPPVPPVPPAPPVPPPG